MFKLIAPAALLLVAAPAFAQIDVVDQPQPPAAQDAKAKQRLICQDLGEIGSRLERHRVCLTAEQWKQHEREEKDAVADYQRRSQRGPE